MMVNALFNLQSYIELLNLPKELSSVLFRDEKQFNNFYTKFYGKNKNAIDDIYDYREWVISESDITEDEFFEMCATYGLKDTFEKTFLQPFQNHDIEFIKNKISNGGINLADIFKMFKDSPAVNIMKYVL